MLMLMTMTRAIPIDLRQLGFETKGLLSDVTCPKGSFRPGFATFPVARGCVSLSMVAMGMALCCTVGCVV